MARQAEAERERRAKIIAAEGELQASEKLGEAADVIAASPGALQLRQLQTMVEISAENNSTIIFPIPIEIMGAISALTSTLSGGKTPTAATTPSSPGHARGGQDPDHRRGDNAMPDVAIPPADIPPPPGAPPA